MLGELVGMDETAKLVTELDRNGELQETSSQGGGQAMVFHGWNGVMIH